MLMPRTRTMLQLIASLAVLLRNPVVVDRVENFSCNSAKSSRWHLHVLCNVVSGAWHHLYSSYSSILPHGGAKTKGGYERRTAFPIGLMDQNWLKSLRRQHVVRVGRLVAIGTGTSKCIMVTQTDGQADR